MVWQILQEGRDAFGLFSLIIKQVINFYSKIPAQQ